MSSCLLGCSFCEIRIDQFHNVCRSLLEQPLAVLRFGDGNFEPAGKATEGLVELTKAGVASLHKGSSWPVFPLEEPEVGSVFLVYPDPGMLVVGE